MRCGIRARARVNIEPHQNVVTHNRLLSDNADGLRKLGKEVAIAHRRPVDKNVLGSERPRECQPLEGPAAGQGHVGLAVGERPTAEVDVYLVEREPLALVDGQRPRQP